MHKKPWFKLVFGVIVLGVIFLVVRALHFDFSNITPEKFKTTIDNFGVWGPIIYIVLYIARPFILFPAALLSAAAGFIWGLEGIIYLLIAANLSSTGEFLIARYMARESIEKLIKGRMEKFEAALERRGFITVLLIRIIPNFPWDIQNLGLGLTKVKFHDYFWATFIGIIPGCFALIYFGASFISVLTNPQNFWKFGVALLIFGGLYMLQRYLKKKKMNAVR